MKIRSALAFAGFFSATTLFGTLLDRSPLVARVAAAEREIPIQDADAGLQNGWQQVFEIPALKSPSGKTYLKPATVTLWVEQGWLSAVRKDSQGDVEWQVALAQPISNKRPVVVIDETFTGFDLSYGDYFIRENLGYLRLQRQRKTADSLPWPEYQFVGVAPAPGGQSTWAGKPVKMTGLRSNQWQWVTGGLPNDKKDVWVRLEHLEIRTKNSNGFSSGFTGGPRPSKAFYGERYAIDEGTLFLAERSLTEIAELNLAHQKLVSEFGDKPAPAISAAEWKNVPATTTLEAYKGKVVLLDFWGTWCLPCIEKLPKVQKLYEKYQDKGLVVIGVHSSDGAETVSAFLEKHGITFPIAIDSGETFESYGIERVPVYFLIDKSGKCVSGFSHSPPDEEEIEQLLQ